VITFLLTILAQEKRGGGSITGLLIILIPMGAILYMTIMPQRKQRQKQAALLSKLDVGDEVITTGGIIGTITFVEDDLYHIEIDVDVVIRIAKSGVAKSLAEPAAAEKGKSSSKGVSRSRKGLLAGALGGAAPEDAESAEVSENSEDSEPAEVDSQASSQQINKK
jgi:preprotein translocase subunit YajC